MIEKVKTFISYSHKDKELKDRFIAHLHTLIRTDQVTLWTDDNIAGGDGWRKSINEALLSSDLIILLISPNFISSQYCYNVELKEAIDMHTQRKAVVVPIGLEPVDITNTSFSELQMLPPDPRFVTLWDNNDVAFTEVIQGIRKTINSLVKEIKNWSPVKRKEGIRRLVEATNYMEACNRLSDFVNEFSKNENLKDEASILISEMNDIDITIKKKMEAQQSDYLSYVAEFRTAVKPIKIKIFEILRNVMEELKASVINNAA